MVRTDVSAKESPREALSGTGVGRKAVTSDQLPFLLREDDCCKRALEMYRGM